MVPLDILGGVIIELVLIGTLCGILIEGLDSKLQRMDEVRQTEYDCICPCLGYKLKGSCRHLPQ